MAWRVAKSLLKLREQVDAAVPARSKSSDGTIGDAAHASRSSDHNPWVKDAGTGVVTAMDITHDPSHGVDSYALADHLREVVDPRVKYVISNYRIWNPSVSPAWRRYTGTNPHNHHVHISVKPTKSLYDDTSAWDIGALGGSSPTSPLHSEDERPVIRKGASGQWVRNLQKMLGVAIDGTFGPLTERAVKAFQKSVKLAADGVVGVYTWDALDQETKDAGVIKKPDVTGAKNVVATVFGGSSDVNKSAYDGHVITDGELGVSLPARLSSSRRVRVINRANGKEAVGPVVDVGPWYTDDPYWETGSRPLAEERVVTHGPNKGRRTNLAGIDLTPALAKRIGVNGMGHVDWEFAD